MTKKQEFLKAFENTNVDQVCVAVSVPNAPNPEYIINTKENFEAKKEYYDKAYNDDLELIAFPSIKILFYNFTKQ